MNIAASKILYSDSDDEKTFIDFSNLIYKMLFTIIYLSVYRLAKQKADCKRTKFKKFVPMVFLNLKQIQKIICILKCFTVFFLLIYTKNCSKVYGE